MPLPREIDMVAGSLYASDRIRVRKAMPRAKAVSVENDGNTREAS